MSAELFGIVAPIYLIAGLGFLWAKLGRPYDTGLVTELITNIGAPSLVFSSLVGLDVASEAMAEMLGATLAALVCFAAIGSLLLRIMGLAPTTYLAPLTFGNSGNMGLPICLFAFGETGLALGVVFFATTALTHFTAGQWLWSGKVSFGQLLRTPLAYASIAAVVVVATETPMPAWLINTTELLGQFTIPLMQFTLGVSLGRFALGRVSRVLPVSALRIGMGFGVGVALASLLGLEGIARAVFIVDCSMPVAVFNYMLAERYGRTPSDVAGLVVLSTLLSFVTLPLILAWVL